MAQIEELFPAGVCCAFSNCPPEHFHLLASEADAALTMGEKRRREFLQGRACARTVLDQLGFPDCPVPVGASREPEWPPGVVGSISHAEGRAAAVAATATHRQGLGIDLEANQALEQSLIPIICRPEELRSTHISDAGPATSKLIFSAKESLFKCVWPILLRFVDFQEIEIRLDCRTRSFRAIPRSGELPEDLIHQVTGRYLQAGELLITAAYL